MARYLDTVFRNGVEKRVKHLMLFSLFLLLPLFYFMVFFFLRITEKKSVVHNLSHMLEGFVCFIEKRELSEELRLILDSFGFLTKFQKFKLIFKKYKKKSNKRNTLTFYKWKRKVFYNIYIHGVKLSK